MRARAETAKEIEILVLRHQLAMLRGPNRPPRLGWADRALIAALTRLRPVHRRFGLLVTPSTILRWHRQLVARRWATKPTRPGRPAISGGLRALIGRLATENPARVYRRMHGDTTRPWLPDRRLHRLENLAIGRLIIHVADETDVTCRSRMQRQSSRCPGPARTGRGAEICGGGPLRWARRGWLADGVGRAWLSWSCAACWPGVRRRRSLPPRPRPTTRCSLECPGRRSMREWARRVARQPARRRTHRRI